MSAYRDAFLGATDVQAYTAIRSRVDGGSEYLSGMKAGQDIDNTLDAGVSTPGGVDPNMPGLGG